MRALRFPIEPGDISLKAAARRMGLTPSAFEIALPELLARGFPRPDATTRLFDLQAINEWRARRHRKSTPSALHADDIVSDRIAAVFGRG